MRGFCPFLAMLGLCMACKDGEPTAGAIASFQVSCSGFSDLAETWAERMGYLGALCEFDKHMWKLGALSGDSINYSGVVVRYELPCLHCVLQNVTYSPMSLLDLGFVPGLKTTMQWRFLVSYSDVQLIWPHYRSRDIDNVLMCPQFQTPAVALSRMWIRMTFFVPLHDYNWSKLVHDLLYWRGYDFCKLLL